MIETAIKSHVQYCFELGGDGPYLANFLKCYFENELYPVDMVGASQQCIIRLSGEATWNQVSACAENADRFNDYVQVVLLSQAYRPLIDQTPHVLLNVGYDDYSNLAAIDLKKALCRVKVSIVRSYFIRIDIQLNFVFRQRTSGSANRWTNTKNLWWRFFTRSTNKTPMISLLNNSLKLWHKTCLTPFLVWT